MFKTQPNTTVLFDTHRIRCDKNGHTLGAYLRRVSGAQYVVYYEDKRILGYCSKLCKICKIEL